MKTNLSLAVLALAALTAAPALASTERGGPRAMLQNLTFAEIDADGDGAVTLEEWRTFVTTRAETMRGARIDARVSEFFAGDADGDGLLSPEELSARITALHDERRAQWAERRAARGAEDRPRRWGNRDGHGRHHGRPEGRMGGRMGAGMDMDQMIVRSFQRIDRDGDARITEAEFDRARSRMTERMERMERRGRQGG